MRRPSAGLAAAALGAWCLTGCAAPADLSFHQDQRISIVEPTSMATVQRQFDVRWTVAQNAHDLPPADGRQWALVVGEFPPAVGSSLSQWLQETVPACRASAVCAGADGSSPDEQLLRDQGVYLASDTTTITVDRLRAAPGGAARAGADVRFWTLVILDASGRRVEESMWYGSVVVDGGRR